VDLFKILESKARKKQKTIILPESYDKRVIEAAKIILKKRTAKIILIRNKKEVPIAEQAGLDIIDIDFSKQFAVEYYSLRRKKEKDISLKHAVAELEDPLLFSNMLLRNNFADAVVAGSVYSTGSVLRSAIRTVGLPKKLKTVSSFFLFTFPKGHKLQNRVLAYADCGVLPHPTAEQLAEIALSTSANYKKLTGITPKTAFLSFSTKGSANSESVDRVIKAYRIAKRRNPNLICDGEVQFDTAFVPAVAGRKDIKGRLKGNANVFIFPDLNSGNIAYKITERIGGGIATGPIIQGLAKPVMDLSRGCSAGDIVNMVTIAALM
jgi:phosphate acetyltransferase